MTETHVCPDCGCEFTDTDDSDPEPRPPVGQCVVCGIDIEYGEWHFQQNHPSDRTPDEVNVAVQQGEDPEHGDRYCAPCSPRDLDTFPDTEPVAGMQDVFWYAPMGEAYHTTRCPSVTAHDTSMQVVKSLAAVPSSFTKCGTCERRESA